MNTKMTTKDLIKILPFEESYKLELLAGLDLMDIDQKFELEILLWKAYRRLFQIKLAKNLQLAFIPDNDEKLDGAFYKRVREQTEKEMQEEAVNTKQEVDLTEARTAMEKIIAEIRASKKH